MIKDFSTILIFYKIRNMTSDLLFSCYSEKFWGWDESPETLILGLDVILLNKCESAELVLTWSSLVQWEAARRPQV